MAYTLLFLLILALPFLLLLAIFAWDQPHPAKNSSYDPELVPGCQLSPDQFYALVYEELIEVFTANKLPFADVRFGPRQLFSRRHVFSHRSVYLEVRYDAFTYLVYAVPTANGLYVSKWLFSKYETHAGHWLFKYLLAWKATQMTLFQMDVMGMFHDLVNVAVNGVLDELRQEEGLPPLEDYERRPALSGFYARLRQGTTMQQGMVLPQRITVQQGALPQQFPVTLGIDSQSSTASRSTMPQSTSTKTVSQQQPDAAAKAALPTSPLADTQPLLFEAKPGTGSLDGLATGASSE